jgi:hypothetical protein
MIIGGKMKILCHVSQSSSASASLPFLKSDEVLLPFRDHWRKVSKELGSVDHAASVVRVPEGVRVWVCCGHKPGYWVGRDELADPYLLDIEDPKVLLRELTEVFAR